jgi:hypothetical protein
MEILQNLLENEILNEETKTELEEAIQSQISEAVEAAVQEAKAETETNVRAELAEQFVTDKEALVEALDTKAQQFLESELTELKEDVEAFRDLEAEYAEKVVNMKKKLSETAKKDFAQLVNILNEFLEERVEAEFSELKEDIDQVKQLRFGEAIFESFKDTFAKTYFNKDEMDAKAKTVEAELEAARKELNEMKEELSATKREQVLSETLSVLEGRPREVMAAILDKTPTDKIQKVYEQFIGRVLNENVVEEDEEKETEVLAEDSNTQEEQLTETVKVTGDEPEVVVEGVEEAGGEHRLTKEEVERLRELTGQLD